MKVIVTIIYTRDPPSQSVAERAWSPPPVGAPHRKAKRARLRTRGATSGTMPRMLTPALAPVRANGGEPGVSSTFEAL